MTVTPVKRALISVSNKQGIVEFAEVLHTLGVEIISTGGTSKVLQAANIPHRQVDELTGLPEMLNGRVKTLHPAVHGGILGRRDEHHDEALQHNISWIDLVVVNFYPFAETIKNKKMAWDEAIEYIDVGGPTMVRAAAKNFAWVGVVVDPLDYAFIISELTNKQGLTFNTRKQLAEKVFALTAQYDAQINAYFLSEREAHTEFPNHLHVALEKSIELRYGENPHQQASAYQISHDQSGILQALQYQGKPLSYNNILDAEAAFNCVSEFELPTCVIVKHANPCGVASADTIENAYLKAYQADPTSAFGGIIALNRKCSKELAQTITNTFMEVIIAPDYADDALAIFASKQNLRVLQLKPSNISRFEFKFIQGGFLKQETDWKLLTAHDLKIVTEKIPSKDDIDNLLFAWNVVKHVKSNAIVIAKHNETLGIGGGQVSRIDAVDIALRKAAGKMQEAVLASDAFFPFRDSIDRLAQTGISAIIEPGGSVRDEEVISACNEHNIAMVFTGRRCFRH